MGFEVHFVKFTAASATELILGNHFDEMDSTFSGLHQALANYLDSIGKTVPEQLLGKSWGDKTKELEELLKFLNDDSSTFHHNSVKKNRSVNRIKKIKLSDFLYFLNEYLIFSKFNDDSLRKLKEEYRKLKNEEYSDKDYCLAESRQHRKTETLHDLSTYIMYYGIQKSDDLNKPQIGFVSITGCWNILSHVFDVVLEVDLFEGEEAFKKSLKRYKKNNCR